MLAVIRVVLEIFDCNCSWFILENNPSFLYPLFPLYSITPERVLLL